MHQGEILPRGVDRIHLAPFEQGEIGSGSIPACLPSPSCSGIAFLCPPDMAADLICPEARREMVFLEQKAARRAFSGAASRTERFDVTAGLAEKPRHPARRVEVREEKWTAPMVRKAPDEACG